MATRTERQIINVAGGTQPTDAVNVRQLSAVGANLATSLGGGAAFNPATGAYTPPTYAVGNQTYANVGAALAETNALAVQYTPNTLGAPTAAVDLTKGGTIAPVSVTGLANATTPTGAVALGQMPLQYSTALAPTVANPAVPSNDVTLVGAAPGAVALHNLAAGIALTDAVNVGQLNGALATNAAPIRTGDPMPYTTTATGLGSLAVGSNALAGLGSTVVGSNATDNGNGNATVVGNGAAVAPGLAGSNVALGQGSTVATAAVAVAGATIGGNGYVFAGAVPTGAVSVGTAAAPRQVQNVAAGRLTGTSTDAVNGSQLFATDTAVTANSNAITAINGGAGIKYFHANSTLPDSSATGINALAVGPQATSIGRDDIAIGDAARAQSSTTNAFNLGAVAIGANATVQNTAGGINGGVALGNGAIATTSNAVASSPVAIGFDANAAGAGPRSRSATELWRPASMRSGSAATPTRPASRPAATSRRRSARPRSPPVNRPWRSATASPTTTRDPWRWAPPPWPASRARQRSRTMWPWAR